MIRNIKGAKTEMIKKFLFLQLFLMIQTNFSADKTQELFENKNILVIGGTGYLGREIISEVLKYNPNKIIIYSRDEVKHFETVKIFKKNPKIKNVIGDIRDYEALLKSTKDMDIVFHVAALKRMDDLEYNVEEAIKTNVIGTLNVFNSCVKNKVKKVLFVSTDKACSPINTYGASKFLVEKIFTNYDYKTIETTFLIVRFGNILESTGSVIPIFKEKIKNGEDITLTDDRMTRFIIDKNEAFDLITNALKYGIGGEIFIRRLPSIKISDLIDVLKNYYNPNVNVKLIGIRPGEKIHEMLINESEIVRTYEFRNNFIITPSIKEWSQNLTIKPIYIQEGRLLLESLIKNYSSENTVISKDKIEQLFKKFEIIK